jgi:hypothetical protein
LQVAEPLAELETMLLVVEVEVEVLEKALHQSYLVVGCLLNPSF